MRIIAAIVLTLLCLAGMSGQVLGWGMAAHAYIAMRCLEPFPSQDMENQALYGAIAVDINNLSGFPRNDGDLIFRDLTHLSAFDLVPQIAGQDDALYWFGQGWLSHNEAWGADYYAHYVNPLCPKEMPGYVEWKVAQLPELKDDLVHEYVEVAVDILIRQKMDGCIGDRVRRAAWERRARVPDLLVLAYSPAVPRRKLRQAESALRAAAITYGETLDLRGSMSKYAFAEALGVEHGISFSRSLDYLERAVCACKPDFRQALECTISLIR